MPTDSSSASQQISTVVVNWNGVNSDYFELCNGVKQGGVMSPLLFSVYLNNLMQDLNRSKLGCYMGAICCNAFAYADDIVILSPTCDALMKMARICEQYAIQFSLSFNPNKCVLIIFFRIRMFLWIMFVSRCTVALYRTLRMKNTWVM